MLRFMSLMNNGKHLLFKLEDINLPLIMTVHSKWLDCNLEVMFHIVSSINIFNDLILKIWSNKLRNSNNYNWLINEDSLFHLLVIALLVHLIKASY